MLLCSFLCNLLVLAAGFGAVAESEPSITTDELRSRILGANERIAAWYIEYESVPRDSPTHNRDSILCRAVALRKNGDFMFRTAKRTADTQWQMDPLLQIVVLNGDRYYWGWLQRRSFIADFWPRDAGMPGTCAGILPWVVWGWWPCEQRPGPRSRRDTPAVLPEVATEEAYVLREKAESCGGVLCHVLEWPGREAIWLDVDRGCTMIKREWYDAHTGTTTWRVEMSKHKEAMPGIWCPIEFRNIHFDYNAPTEKGRKRRVIDATLKVLDVKLNEDVLDELFEIPEPRPGAIQVSDDGSFKQIVPGGYDYMDKVADWIRRNTEYEKPVAKVSATEIVCHVVVVLISLYIIYWCWKSSPALGSRWPLIW